MRRTPLISAIVGGLLILVIAMTGFIAPGVRHAHKNGDSSHSHTSTSGHHSHSHGTHTHSHSHGGHRHSHFHRHSHESDREGHEYSPESAEVVAAHSHIHMQFLWFELTLPDWFGDDSAVSISSSDADGVSQPHRRSVDADVVIISSPFTFSQLVQVLMLSFGPIPERTHVPSQSTGDRVLLAVLILNQRVPDDVPVPPPELS